MIEERRLWNVTLQGRDMYQPMQKTLCDECIETYPSANALDIKSKREVSPEVIKNYHCNSCEQPKPGVYDKVFRFDPVLKKTVEVESQKKD